MPDLSHNDPGDDAPSGSSWTPNVTYEVLVDFDASTPRMLVFRSWLREFSTPPDENLPHEPTPTGVGEPLHHIPIEQDCYVLVWLSHNVDWHWQRERALTIAKDMPDRYFKLQYLTSAGWRTQPLSGEATRCVRMGARFRGGEEPVDDLFNMNILLENPEGPPLPITIDPDIQNPRV